MLKKATASFVVRRRQARVKQAKVLAIGIEELEQGFDSTSGDKCGCWTVLIVVFTLGFCRAFCEALVQKGQEVMERK